MKITVHLMSDGTWAARWTEHTHAIVYNLIGTGPNPTEAVRDLAARTLTLMIERGLI